MTNNNVDINSDKKKTEFTKQKVKPVAYKPENLFINQHDDYPKTNRFLIQKKCNFQST